MKNAEFSIFFISTVYVRSSGLDMALLDSMPKKTILWSVLLVTTLAYVTFANILSMLLIVISIIALRSLII